MPKASKKSVKAALNAMEKNSLTKALQEKAAKEKDEEVKPRVDVEFIKSLIRQM